MTIRVVAVLCLLAGIAAVPARAQDLVLDAEQWGNVNLVVRQSLGGSVEALLTGSGKHEPLRTYDERDRLRRLSNPVGRLDVRFADKKFVTCTATLVEKDLILTNNHCVPGANDNLAAHGPVVEAALVMNYYDEAQTHLVDRYAVDIRPVATNADRDFSFLRVQGEPGAKWGTAAIITEAPRPGASLLVIHHPAGLPKHVTRYQCRAASPTPTDSRHITLFHFCDTLPGSSGAPIFSDEHGAIIAIHRAGATVTGPGATNYGVLIAAMQEDAGGDFNLAIATPEANAPAPEQMTPTACFVYDVRPPDDWLALRSEPSTRSGRQLKKLPSGTAFVMLGEQDGSWYRVQLEETGEVGWVSWASKRWIQCE